LTSFDPGEPPHYARPVTWSVVGEVQWAAVLVAAAVYFALGAAWYAPPVLGRVWQAAGGTGMGAPSTNGHGSPAARSRGGAAAFVVPFVGALASAVAIGVLAAATDAATGEAGLLLGLLVGLGIAVPVALVTAAFETRKPRPFLWGAVNGGYHLLGCVVAALIVVLWG
jgi:hypothetical protein